MENKNEEKYSLTEQERISALNKLGKKLTKSQLLKAEAWGLLWMAISWYGFKILVFLIFLFLNQSTSDISLMSGIALIPAALVFYKVQERYKRKYLASYKNI